MGGVCVVCVVRVVRAVSLCLFGVFLSLSLSLSLCPSVVSVMRQFSGAGELKRDEELLRLFVANQHVR